MAINAVLQPGWRARFRAVIKKHIYGAYNDENKANQLADDAVNEIEADEEAAHDADSDLDSDGG